jgi:hypothetical protein
VPTAEGPQQNLTTVATDPADKNNWWARQDTEAEVDLVRKRYSEAQELARDYEKTKIN